jgi:hypothetical protein
VEHREVGRIGSRRYTRPGEIIRIGGLRASIVRIWTGEVCVRKSRPPSR